ncbi:MAG: hypothetical protein V8Q42_10850 [Anaerovoracaceae bacterium]
MKTDGQSTELILSRDDGNGSMTFSAVPGYNSGVHIHRFTVMAQHRSWMAARIEERPRAAGSGSADDAGDLKPPLLIDY